MALVEMDQGTISRLEGRKTPYSDLIMDALADALRCQPWDLYRHPAENRLASYVMGLNGRQQWQALRILKAALGEEDEIPEGEMAATTLDAFVK